MRRCVRMGLLDGLIVGWMSRVDLCWGICEVGF